MLDVDDVDGDDTTLAPLLDVDDVDGDDDCAFIWLEKYIFTVTSDKINTIVVQNNVFFISCYLPPGVHFDLL